jgi:hypothetical protein
MCHFLRLTAAMRNQEHYCFVLRYQNLVACDSGQASATRGSRNAGYSKSFKLQLVLG